MPDHTTADLTPAERLVVRRRRAGLSQAEMANSFHYSMRQYRRMENGEIEVTPSILRGYLKPHEWLYIRRRRAGLSRAQLAKALKVSKRWVTLMEHGEAPVAKLQEYWESR